MVRESYIGLGMSYLLSQLALAIRKTPVSHVEMEAASTWVLSILSYSE